MESLNQLLGAYLKKHRKQRRMLSNVKFESDNCWQELCRECKLYMVQVQDPCNFKSHLKVLKSLNFAIE